MSADVIARGMAAGRALATNLGAVSGPSLQDDFRRADTLAGALGAGWSLYGAFIVSYPLPPATDGQISAGTFVDVGGTVVYATRQARQTVRHLSVEWSWIDDAVGTDFTTLACMITNSANLIDTMLHITVTNGVVNIQKRISGGSFITLNTGQTSISPALSLAGVHHVISIDVNDAGTKVRVRIDDAFDVTVTDADIASIIGNRIVVEHYSATTSVRYPLTIYDVRAAATSAVTFTN